MKQIVENEIKNFFKNKNNLILDSETLIKNLEAEYKSKNFSLIKFLEAESLIEIIIEQKLVFTKVKNEGFELRKANCLPINTKCIIYTNDNREFKALVSGFKNGSYNINLLGGQEQNLGNASIELNDIKNFKLI